MPVIAERFSGGPEQSEQGDGKGIEQPQAIAPLWGADMDGALNQPAETSIQPGQPRPPGRIKVGTGGRINLGIGGRISPGIPGELISESRAN